MPTVRLTTSDRLLVLAGHGVPARAHDAAVGRPLAALADVEAQRRPVHPESRMVVLRDLPGVALDVVADQCAAEAVGGGVGRAAMDQRTVAFMRTGTPSGRSAAAR
jgi:hypothetical protein